MGFQLFNTGAVRFRRAYQFFVREVAFFAQQLVGFGHFFYLLAHIVVIVDAEGDFGFAEVVQFRADSAQFGFKFLQADAVVVGGTHQLFVGQAALLLQQAESGIDLFYLLLDFFVVVETEGDFGFTEVIQFFPGFAGALADDANVIGCLVGGLGEVMQALGLVISAEAVPFLPQLCSGIGQLSGFAAGLTDALDKAVKVLHPVHTGGNQEFGGYSVGHGNTIMGRWCHCLWRGLMPLVAAFQRTKKARLRVPKITMRSMWRIVPLTASPP